MVDFKWRRGMTSAELIAALHADPEWVRENAEREARHAASVAQLRAEMEPEHAPLRRDLAGVGLPVRSLAELVNMSAPYPDAVPVLLRHLAAVRHPVLRQMLARALTVEEARGVAGGPIIQELKREQDSEARWAMANALTIVAAPGDANEIEALHADPAYQDVRERLGQALRNLRHTSGRRSGPKRRTPNPSS
jgi:hypothetical protein